MAKAVLGNDPFQRGAAPKEPPAVQPVEPRKARTPVRKRWKARTSVIKTPPLEPQARSTQTSAQAPAIPTATSAAPRVAGATGDLARGVYRALRAALGMGDGPLDALGQDAQLVRDLTPLADFLYDWYWRITFEGAENLPTGRCVLAANHGAALPIEGPMLRLALERQRAEPSCARWLVEENILRIPVLGVLLNRLGAVTATPENAMKLLAEGRQLIVFPEGIQAIKKTFRDRYRLNQFGRGGFVKIAARAHAPIVPVAIVGAAEASPVLANLPLPSFGLKALPITVPPLPSKWCIRVGPSVDVRELDPEDASAVAEVTEHVRSRVERMLDDIVR